MYALVLDVERYPSFLSWVTTATVNQQTENKQYAGLSVNVAGIRTQFQTHNQLEPNRRIIMQLQEGPFKSLQGIWEFNTLGDLGCKVALSLDFEIEQRLLSSAFQQGFTLVGNRLVKDFVRQAEQHYGG